MPEAPPKFASFRAKPAVPSAAPSGTTSPDRRKIVRDREEDQPIRRQSSHRHHHSRRRRNEEQSAGEIGRKEQDLERKDDVLPVSPQESYEEPSDLFIVDRRGDLGNVKYGYNERYKVPVYREPSLRKLLGDNGRFSDSRSHKGSPLALLSREDRRRLRDDNPTYVTSDNSQQCQTDLDFIVLNPGKKRKRGSDEAALISKHDARNRVKGHGEHDGASATSDDTSDASESDNEATEINIDDKAVLKADKVRLSALVKEQPQSVAAWLDFINFQERWTYQGQEVEEFALPKEEQQSLADVKLSIYKKALAAVPISHPERETLLLGMMKESELVLEGEKLRAKWQSVVAENPTCLKLGQNFLNYMQSTLAGFDFNATCERYATFISQLSKSKHTSSLYVYTILRLTVFMSEAGYYERAHALWQAVFELAVFTTYAETTSWHETLMAFETFWEEERPRIGDQFGACGWQDPQTSLEPQPSDSAVSNNETGSKRNVRRWLQHESKRTRKVQRPGRVVDDPGDSEDMHHLVLLSDIRPFLFYLRCEGFPVDLVNAFLCFMHLPPLPNDDIKLPPEEMSKPTRESNDYWLDEFLRNELLTDDSRSPSGFRMLKHHIDHHQTTLHELFTDGNYIGVELPTMNWEQTHDRLEPARTGLIRWLMQALLKKFPAWSALAEYYLALERTIDWEGMEKLMAERLLKARKSSLRMYNTYALVGTRPSRSEDPDQILGTAIRMSSTFPVEEQPNVIHLWHTRMTKARNQGDLGLALQRCLMISRAGLMRDNPAEDIQEAEHFFNTGRQRALEASHFHLAAVYSTCLSTLYYFSSESISTAIEAYSTQCAILASYGPAATSSIEYLHQERVVLMEDHMARKRSYKPKEIRQALQDSIGAFPTNTIFLQLFVETESRFRIDDRVRQLTRDVWSRTPDHSSGDSATSERSSNLIIHVFNIDTELQRTETAGSTRHAVRAAFERAVTDRRCRHCASIWYMYLYYEVHLAKAAPTDVSQKGEGVSRVKDVFYRGLRCLPWIKMWYLRGIEVLMKFGLEEEARSLAALMVDKGLRVFEELSVASTEVEPPSPPLMRFVS